MVVRHDGSAQTFKTFRTFVQTLVTIIVKNHREDRRSSPITSCACVRSAGSIKRTLGRGAVERGYRAIRLEGRIRQMRFLGQRW